MIGQQKSPPRTGNVTGEMAGKNHGTGVIPFPPPFGPLPLTGPLVLASAVTFDSVSRFVSVGFSYFRFMPDPLAVNGAQ